VVDTVKLVYAALDELRTALLGDIRTKDMTVRMMYPANRRAENARDGWVGLYIDTVAYTPRSAGAGVQNWNSETTLRVVVQASDLADTGRAFEKVSEYLKNVLDVIMANKVLFGQAEMMGPINVDFAIREEEAKTLHFIGALVTLRYTGRTN
jgi:hypothetical protein